MIRKLQTLKEQPLARYVFIGGTSYIVEMIILLAILYGVGTNQAVATGIAYWFGLIMAFVLQKFIAFRDYRRQLRALTKQGAAYGALTLWNYFFSIAVVSLFPAELILVSRTLAQAIFSCWNYLLYKNYIFKQ